MDTVIIDLNGQNHLALLAFAPPFFAFLRASDKKFIYFHFAFQRHLFAALHSLHDFSLKQPTGLLSQFKLSVQFMCGHPYLASNDHKYDIKGFLKWKFHVVKQSVGRGWLIIVAFCTTATFWLLACKIFEVATFRTAITIFPFYIFQVLVTFFICWKFITKTNYI